MSRRDLRRAAALEAKKKAALAPQQALTTALVPMYDCPHLRARIFARQCDLNRATRPIGSVDPLQACRDCPGVVELARNRPATYVRARLRQDVKPHRPATTARKQ